MFLSRLFNKRRSDALLLRVRNGGDISLREQITLVILLCVPALLAQLSHIVMEYIDAAMVGHLGAEASASVGLMASSLWLVWGLCGAVAAGFNVMVALRVGARDYKAARHVFRQGLVFCLLFSIILSVGVSAISGVLPLWLGGDEDIVEGASDYFGLLSLFLPAVQTTMFCSGVLRSSGNMLMPSIVGVCMCCLDVVFNFFFIFPTREVSVFNFSFTIPGADLGVFGAALGTICAQIAAGSILLWFVICRSRELHINGESNHLRLFIPQRSCLHSALRISLPMAFQHIAMNGAQVVSTTIVAPLGKMSIAANSFGVTAESLCYMPGYGIADAAQTLVGQTLGAKRCNLMRSFAKVSLMIGMIVMTIMGVVMYVAAPLLMGFLTPVERIKDLGVEALRIEAFAEPMFAASIVCYGIFVGTGDTIKPCLMNLFSLWAVRLTLAWWLAPQWGLNGVWTAMCIELCFRGLIFLLRLRFGRWDAESHRT